MILCEKLPTYATPSTITGAPEIGPPVGIRQRMRPVAADEP